MSSTGRVKKAVAALEKKAVAALEQADKRLSASREASKKSHEAIQKLLRKKDQLKAPSKNRPRPYNKASRGQMTLAMKKELAKKTGKVVDPETGRLRSPKARGRVARSPCRDGKVRDHATKRCRSPLRAGRKKGSRNLSRAGPRKQTLADRRAAAKAEGKVLRKSPSGRYYMSSPKKRGRKKSSN